MRKPRTILITGASSGIGAALAMAYAEPEVRLILGGRDARRLDDIAAMCTAKGARARGVQIEVTDSEAMWEWLQAVDARYPLDLLITSAGISGGTAQGSEARAQTEHISDVNIAGTLNTVLPVLPRMERRGRGQIALLSSLAGYRGLPSCPAYSASKAWVMAYGDALRGYYARKGVHITVVAPGYVDTPLTRQNSFPMPLLMTPEKAAGKIRKGLERRRARIAFPWQMVLPVWLLSCLPAAISDSIYARLPGK